MQPDRRRSSTRRFPTRRSSDLKYEEEARQRWGNAPEWEESQRRWKKYTDKDWAEIKKEGGEIIDRKSTRLNSSHLVISYAVFCLKKKTKHLEKSATQNRRMDTA